MSRTESANTVDIPATGSVGVIRARRDGPRHSHPPARPTSATWMSQTLHRAAADDLVAGGAEFQRAPAAVAAHAEVVVLSLNTAPIVEQVVFGGDGVLPGGVQAGMG